MKLEVIASEYVMLLDHLNRIPTPRELAQALGYLTPTGIAPSQIMECYSGKSSLAFRSLLQKYSVPPHLLPTINGVSYRDASKDSQTHEAELVKNLTKHSRVKQYLTPEQHLAVNAVLDTTDRRSRSAKLKALGIHPGVWQRWQREPQFSRYLREEADRRFKEAEPISKNALIRLVESEDLNAIKYFHEVSGVYRPQQETMQNLAVILARIMEVLATLVTPDVLDVIASRLEDVLASNPDKPFAPHQHNPANGSSGAGLPSLNRGTIFEMAGAIAVQESTETRTTVAHPFNDAPQPESTEDGNSLTQAFWPVPGNSAFGPAGSEMGDLHVSPKIGRAHFDMNREVGVKPMEGWGDW